MPRPRKKVPAYSRHKASGQAVVRIDGRDHYLGPYGSPESHDEYNRVLAEWRLSLQERAAPKLPTGVDRASAASVSVAEVLADYWAFAKRYYSRGGKPTSELMRMKDALKPVKQLYGRTPAAQFGPLSLKAVREHMVGQGLCRTEINKRIGRIKRAFKWAVSEELVPASVYHGLQAVEGLKYGRTEARESDPVRPVPNAHIDALLPFLRPQVGAMVQLQRLTGMRPCEVVLMRACDIDTSGEVWLYEPADHKNRWRGHHRTVPLGPKAQEIIRPFLDRDPQEFFFSPSEAEEQRNLSRTVRPNPSRRTPIYPSELRARERRKEERSRRERKRPPRERYDTDSYRRAVTYALKRAKAAGVEVPHWHPHQLRHLRATELRKSFGIEAAQVSLGHARADVTQIYAEKNLGLAIKVAAETG